MDTILFYYFKEIIEAVTVSVADPLLSFQWVI
jgi:hypothetical protein